MLLRHGRLSTRALCWAPGRLRRPAPALRSISTAERAQLILRLCDNSELDEHDAEVELGWLRQCIDGTVSSARPDAPTAAAGASTALEQLQRMVDRRAKGEPIQYILGDTPFGPLSLLCRPPTLIPRSETAYIFDRLAERIVSLASPAQPAQCARLYRILDICTGSGCIPLLLAHRLRSRLSTQSWGYDLSPSAVALAEDNRRHLALPAEEVSFAQADLFDQGFVERVRRDMGGRADLVTANPPYISRDLFGQLPRSVSAYEDPRALLGEVDNGDTRGLAFYHRIAETLPSLPPPEGEDQDGQSAEMPRVALEIGEEQGEAVSALLRAKGLTTEVWKDQYDRPRLVVGFAQA